MYTDHYGLSERPFQLTPDARYWYDSRTHKKAMAYLGYGIAQAEGFIVVTGEIGAGKSTLVAHLLATIDRERLNAIPLASTQIGPDDMLRLAGQGLGIATERLEKAQLLDRIEQRLIDDVRAGKRCLLIVDEAQNLSPESLEELRLLSNFSSNGRALIQILLLGQPEFRDRLGGEAGLEQLRQRVIATHHLDALGENEVEPYIIHRLAVAGWQGRPAFAPDAFAALHRHSGGIPRRLNQLAARLLLFGAVEQLDTIGAAAVDAVASDAAAERPRPRSETAPQSEADARSETLLQLREASEPVADFTERRLADRRIAALEARLDEQEAIVRRVLTLLVEWVEKDEPGYRTNAA